MYLGHNIFKLGSHPPLYTSSTITLISINPTLLAKSIYSHTTSPKINVCDKYYNRRKFPLSATPLCHLNHRFCWGTTTYKSLWTNNNIRIYLITTTRRRIWVTTLIINIDQSWITF